MRSTRLRWVLAGAAALAAASLGPGAFAASSTTQTINFSFDPNYGLIGGGGEFEVTLFTGMTLPLMAPNAAVGGSLFQTFCLEDNEGISGYGPFDWTISDSAHAGGVGGATNGADPICSQTAYLYSEFWDGTLSNYDYSPGLNTRALSAYQLQRAIWYLENEITSLDAVGDAQALLWIDEANAAIAGNAWSGIGGVRVLTITDTIIGNRQDVLVKIEDTPPPPPPPPGGGGLTPGFWQNKNGQKLIDSGDLAMLRALHLCKADGTAFDPTTKTQVKNWILTDATNMAFKLSSQLAAMALNVSNGFVNSGALVYCDTGVDPSGKISISDLMAKADAALAADSYTPTGDPNRAYQELLKNALDAANNNLNWVP